MSALTFPIAQAAILFSANSRRRFNQTKVTGLRVKHPGVAVRPQAAHPHACSHRLPFRHTCHLMLDEPRIEPAA
jgi:hypothetical protein